MTDALVCPPYYTDDLVTLYHGDCREILPTIAGPLAFDVAVTDPPVETVMLQEVVFASVLGDLS